MKRTRCLQGLAAGDALGEPIEGLSRSVIGERFGVVDRFLGPPKITDDTMLSLLVAESILECGKVNRKALGKRFVENRGQLSRLGPSTLSALSRLEEDPLSTASTGTTNGGAMRAPPVGLSSRTLNECIEQTVESTLITHGSDAAISAACAVSCAVWKAVESEDMNEVIKAALIGARKGAGYGTPTEIPAVDETIELALSLTLDEAVDRIGNGMEAVETVPLAFKCFYDLKETEDAVTAAVNLGGDTDTLGSITGALSGTFTGELPDRWVLAQISDDLERLEKGLLSIRYRH